MFKRIMNLCPVTLDFPGIKIPPASHGTGALVTEAGYPRLVGEIPVGDGAIDVGEAPAWGEIEGLPSLAEMTPDTGYIVSVIVAAVLRERGDERLSRCLVVGTPVRDAAGRIVGASCLRLAGSSR